MNLKITSTSEIINSQDIQNAYMNFYSYMMDYLWNLKVVKNLATLEISIFQRFPDKDEMENALNALEVEIRDTLNDEENPDSKDFKDSFEVMKDYIERYTDNGYEIWNMQPEVNVEEILEEDDSDGKLHVGKVVTKDTDESEEPEEDINIFEEPEE